MSGLILMLVWPAGRAVAILAVLIVLVIHLLLGPYAAGQRDYLMSIPALAAALASARAGEDRRHRWLDLLLAGAFAVTAAAIKPSGILLLGLPVVAMGGSTMARGGMGRGRRRRDGTSGAREFWPRTARCGRSSR